MDTSKHRNENKLNIHTKGHMTNFVRKEMSLIEELMIFVKLSKRQEYTLM
jgi:hypothetical protein